MPEWQEGLQEDWELKATPWGHASVVGMAPSLAEGAHACPATSNKSEGNTDAGGCWMKHGMRELWRCSGSGHLPKPCDVKHLLSVDGSWHPPTCTICASVWGAAGRGAYFVLFCFVYSFQQWLEWTDTDSCLVARTQSSSPCPRAGAQDTKLTELTPNRADPCRVGHPPKAHHVHCKSLYKLIDLPGDLWRTDSLREQRAERDPVMLMSCRAPQGPEGWLWDVQTGDRTTKLTKHGRVNCMGQPMLQSQCSVKRGIKYLMCFMWAFETQRG